MMSEPLSDRTVFISYLEMTRARPLDSCAQAQTSNIYVFVCMCVEALTKSRSLVLTLKPVNKPMSRIVMDASVLFLYLNEKRKQDKRQDPRE